MWQNPGEMERLLLARTRQRELIAEGRAVRLGLRKPSEGTRNERVQGLRLRLGRVLIVIGRTIYEDEQPCPDMVA